MKIYMYICEKNFPIFKYAYCYLLVILYMYVCIINNIFYIFFVLFVSPLHVLSPLLFVVWYTLFGTLGLIHVQLFPELKDCLLYMSSILLSSTSCSQGYTNHVVCVLNSFCTAQRRVLLSYPLLSTCRSHEDDDLDVLAMVVELLIFFS